MSQTVVDVVLDGLWPTYFPSPRVELFAILDGAQDERIHRELPQSGLAFRCLYAGKLPREILEVAPYLVHLPADAPFLRWLISEGWGRNWGVFFQSPAPLEDLRRHFRRFLRVRDEHNRYLLFRYYDPRVLAAYLPTCTNDELATVFGPVTSFYAEVAEGRSLLELRREGTRLQTRHRGLAEARTC